MEIKNFKLTSATMELIFNYLIDKPYKEVAQIINQIQTDIQNGNKVDKTEEVKE